MLKTSFIALLLIGATAGILHQLDFYTELDLGGDALRIRNHQRNLTSYHDILINHKSFCWAGYWLIYDAKNYANKTKHYYSAEEVRECFNGQLAPYWINANSLRYVGSPNTTTIGLSLYETMTWEGKEIFVDEAGLGNITEINPRSYASTGHSNWTTFTGPDFDGESRCLTASPDSNVRLGYIFGEPVQSVRLGCEND